MVASQSRKRRTVHLALELCGWLLIFALGVWEVVKAPHHVGGFGAWLQVSVSLMSIVASLWRWRTGDR